MESKNMKFIAHGKVTASISVSIVVILSILDKNLIVKSTEGHFRHVLRFRYFNCTFIYISIGFALQRKI